MFEDIDTSAMIVEPSLLKIKHARGSQLVTALGMFHICKEKINLCIVTEKREIFKLLGIKH
jgi:hypothetical protein